MRIRYIHTLLLAALVCSWPARAQLRFTFDEDERRWSLNNGWVEADFRLTPEGLFNFERFFSYRSTRSWRAPGQTPSSPIRFMVDSVLVDARTPFLLREHYVKQIDRSGLRQVIVLDDPNGQFSVELSLEMFDNQPVLRHQVTARPMGARRAVVQIADIVPYVFADDAVSFGVLRVNQWSVVPQPQNFEPIVSTLDPKGEPVKIAAGAHGQQCAWLAIRDDQNRGLFAGWEFDGRSDALVRRWAKDSLVQLNVPINELYHPVDPGGVFVIPAGFIGTFKGDWDEAGYRTQRFAEAVLAKPAPDSQFPYAVWDSWGYQASFTESALRRNAEIAASIGIELFVVDLGWAQKIGDWREDPKKFSSGLRALSDYVHSLGMKFGLHFALAEAAPDSEVLISNPDWTSSVESYNYFGAKSLCLSHQPVKEWLVEQAVRMIDDYKVDWILQDGENMVKECTKDTHTHDPRDSNYSNAVDGLNAVIQEVQRQRPNTYWENCEDGGNMMTFNMVRNYVTSITNDASGSRSARQAVYGATYPFPPRYADRYMADGSLSRYTTRSFVFGGPWVFMNRLPEMSSTDLRFAATEIALFKAIRGKIRDGKVIRLTPRPSEGNIDALQSYHEPTNSSVAVVTRDASADDHVVLRLGGLDPDTTYRVRFQDDQRVLTMTGRQLMDDGVLVSLADKLTAEVVFVDPI